jgi:ribosomal protein S28E/S33
MNRVDEVYQAKLRTFVERQNGRVQQRNRQSNVAGPVVQAEIIESAMRPRTMRAIPKRHEHPEKEIQCNCANGHKSDVGRKVEDGYAHGPQ